MSQAKKGDTVKVHYTGKLEDGTEFDSSVSREPLEFTIGQDQVIAGFDQSVVGMDVGESKTTKLSAEEAYGPHLEEMVLVVEREQFPDHIDPKLGQRLELRQSSGEAVSVRVTDISDSSVTLDANHPLAGEDLVFEIELVEII
jgi:peptidylprolyl isomerase